MFHILSKNARNYNVNDKENGVRHEKYFFNLLYIVELINCLPKNRRCGCHTVIKHS